MTALSEKFEPIVGDLKLATQMALAQSGYVNPHLEAFKQKKRQVLSRIANLPFPSFLDGPHRSRLPSRPLLIVPPS